MSGSKTHREARKIKMLLLTISPKLLISVDAMNDLVGMLRDASQRLMASSQESMLKEKRKTLKPRNLEAAVRLIFGDELAKEAIIKGNRDVESSGGGDIKYLYTIFKPSWFKRDLKESNRFPRISKPTPLFLAAVIECLCIKLLENSHRNAMKQKRKRITPEHLRLGVGDDPALLDLFKNSRLIVGAGTFDSLTTSLSSLSINNNNNNNNKDNDNTNNNQNNQNIVPIKKSREAIAITRILATFDYDYSREKYKITVNAMNDLIGLLSDVSERLMVKSHELMLKDNSRTFRLRDIRNAIIVLFSGELIKHAIVHGLNELPRWECVMLKLVPSWYKKDMIKSNRFPRIAKLTPIFFTAVIEYLCSEILYFSIHYAQEENRKRITPKDIRVAIKNDEELFDLFRNSDIINRVATKDEDIHDRDYPREKPKYSDDYFFWSEEEREKNRANLGDENEEEGDHDLDYEDDDEEI